MCLMSMSGRGAAGRPDGGRRFVSSEAREPRRGVSVLMYACQQGDVESVRRLLHVQDYIVHQRDRTGKSAVHYCCTSDSKLAAQAADLVLMAAPDLVDGRDEDGFTPLHLAVIAGNMPLVTFLLASKADVNAVDSEKHTVVHWATVCGETEALRHVLAAGAPVSTPDVHGGYPLHYAAQMCGGEKDYQLGYQVLQTLLSHSDISVSVADGDGRQPLLWAASAGSARAILALIKAGAAVEASDKDGLTALHCAASRGHTDCLDTLLTLCGASVDVIDSNGCTALHYSVTLGHADATALLLAHGANANRQDRKGRSPAHCGCAKGQFETVKMLGAHGANLWLRNARGDLPLHEAAGSGRRDLVKWLLEARPSQVNARNNDGRCPLHLAALNDNADMCKILLDLGAQVNPVLRTSKNNFMTPLDCAMQRGFRSTAKYLQLQGGVLANRLSVANQTKLGDSTVTLQIRDDVTLWGENSDSENEKVSPDEKRRKRSYKRKIAYKYERKPATESLKKSSSKEDKGKSDGEKFTYNTKVEISDNAATINVQQNGSETVAKENSKKEEEVAVKVEARPKSGKQASVRRKTKADTPDPRRKEGTVGVGTSPSKTVQDINDNIREIESLAQSIEEKAKSICKEVNVIDGSALPDAQSLTSFEEGEQHRELVVEASVHPEPASNQKQQNQEEMYKEVIALLKEELDSIKAEIKSIKEVGSGNITEEKIQALIADVKAGGEKDAMVELTELLEGRMLEIKATVEEFKVDIKSAIKSGEVNPDLSELLAESIKRQQELSDKLVEVGNSKEFEGQMPVAEEGLQGESEPVGTAENFLGDIVEAPAKPVSEDIIEVPTDDVATEENVVEEQPVVKEDQQVTEDQEERPVLSDDKEAQLKVEDVVEEQIHGNGKDSDKLSTEVKDDEHPPSEAKEDEEVLNQVTKTENQLQAKIEEDGLLPDEVKELQHLSNEPKENGPGKAKKDEQVPVDEGALIGEAKKSDERPDKTDIEGGVRDDKPSSAHSQFLKSQKRDHHLHIPDVNPDSSVEAKSSEEELQASDTSDSSFSSAATKREHKSFTVLDEAHTHLQRNNRRKSSRKSRSRSEETRLKNKENAERLRRSKIPTALGKGNVEDSTRRSKSNLESRVPVLPNLSNDRYKTRSETNLLGVYSDNEASDMDGGSLRKRKVRKRAKTRSSKSAGGGGGGSDYESSNLIDSGFEPSPRSSRMPKWRNVSDRGVNMTSVTQSIQGNIRRYHLERKMFQHLLDLKRMQIRAGQHNEAILVKRAIDSYHRSCASTVGAGRYNPKDFSFKSFEYFLYDSLRKIQKNNGPDYLRGLPATATENPLLCTQSTNRCMHATHAYTGIPCAAYLPKMDHHTIPKIGFNDMASCKPQGFLPDINMSGKKAVTLELCHGSDKQIISLPTDRLDQNKRYYVTFTVKGHHTDSSQSDKENAKEEISHQHSKSD